MDTPENLADLPSIETQIVLDTLKERHAQENIYTRNSSVLIAINPYKRVPSLYEDATIETYKASLAVEREAPHVFAVSAKAHRSMISTGRDQAILISGESGAGKTESANFMLQYLRYVTQASSELERRVYVSQPLTEAFGCAKTTRNDNSSRFGKFIALKFDSCAVLSGAVLSTYLLEKSRVTHIGPGERSYHIFYCLLRGASAAQRASLKLHSQDPKDYHYLRSGEAGEAGGERSDQAFFGVVEDALAAQGLSERDVGEVWKLVASVLHLGCVAFDESSADAAAVSAASAAAVSNFESLVGLQAGALAKALTKRKLKTGHDFVEQNVTLATAIDLRDALSKAVYTRYFKHLTKQINAALQSGQTAQPTGRARRQSSAARQDTAVTRKRGNSVAGRKRQPTVGASQPPAVAAAPAPGGRTIGIVDIFGFEVFETNSLEQLCINYANERLQSLFTHAVFTETQLAYELDGIQAAEITFTDNAALLGLLEAAQTGLLALLSEECQVPKGSDDGFCQKVHSTHAKSPLVSRVKGKLEGEAFAVDHFAGTVNYSTHRWLEKNKDPLSGTLEDLLSQSTNGVLRSLFEQPDLPPAAPGDRDVLHHSQLSRATSGGPPLGWAEGLWLLSGLGRAGQKWVILLAPLCRCTPRLHRIAGRKFKSTAFQGVVGTFRAQLSELVTVLKSSELHFVRCFKPNDAKAADLWDEDVIKRQLHTSGVLDALRVARSGFPDRIPFAEFRSTFATLWQGGSAACLALPVKEGCAKLLHQFNVSESRYKLGRERIFFAAGILESLRALRVTAMAAVAVQLQAGARGQKARAMTRKLFAAVAKARGEMEAAAAGEAIEALRSAINQAVAARVGAFAGGAAAVKKCEERLSTLEAEAAARATAEAALNSVLARLDTREAPALEDSEIPQLEEALAKAVETRVSSYLVEQATRRLQRLKEEEQQRREEEERRVQEEARLAAIAAEEEKRLEEKRLEEERQKRKELLRQKMKEAAAAEAAAKRAAEEKRQAEEAERKRVEEEERNAAAAARLAAARAAQEAEAARLKEEEEADEREAAEDEAMRKATLERINAQGLKFKSEVDDVIEFGIYLGMDLPDDVQYLHIAEKALQAAIASACVSSPPACPSRGEIPGCRVPRMPARPEPPLSGPIPCLVSTRCVYYRLRTPRSGSSTRRRVARSTSSRVPYST